MLLRSRAHLLRVMYEPQQFSFEERCIHVVYYVSQLKINQIQLYVYPWR